MQNQEQPLPTMKLMRNMFTKFDYEMIDYIFKKYPNIMNLTEDVKYKVGKNEKITKITPITKITKITPWSTIKRGGANNKVLPYLIEKGYIDVNMNLVEVLAQMISFSCSLTHTEQENFNMIKQIDFLIIYIGTTNPNLLINYRDSYGLTLLHIIFHGHALNIDRERWFDLFIYYGVDPLIKSDPEDGSPKSGGQFGLQTIQELAARNLNYNVLLKCISYGANVNEFELDNSRNGRNVIQEILFTYADKEYHNNPIMKITVYNIIWLLIYAGIDLTYKDNDGNNVMHYMNKYDWTIILD